MAKIKGWKKTLNMSGDIIWKGDDGDKVRVTVGQYLGMKPWIMGANGQLHIKQANTKKEAIAYAMSYMKSYPRG